MSKHDPKQWQRALQFYQQANLPAARAACDAMLAADPTSPQVHWLQSCIALNQRRFRDAVMHARHAASQPQSLPPAQVVATTRALIAVGEYRATHQILDLIEPDADERVLVAIAEQRLMLGEPLEALRASERAIAAGAGRDPMLSFLHSNALRYTGDIAGAARQLEALIADYPNHAFAHWALSTIGDREGAAARAARVESVLAGLPEKMAAQPGQTSPWILLGYALFRERDALGDSEGAWQALAQAMAAQQRETPYRAAAEDRLFELLRETYTADFVGAAASGGPTPIFIVGLPRSGTTLVERMLGRHPLVAACGELNEFAMAYRWAVDDFSTDFLDARAARDMAKVDAAEIGEAYLRATAWRRGDKPFFTDKHQSNFLFAGLILRALPGAKIIHVEREATDACFSNLKEVYSPLAYPHSYSLADMAHHHGNYRRLMAHLDEVAPGRILRVRYEELVADPQAQVARMLDYCGLPADAGLTDIASNPDPVSTASSAQVREGVHARNVGGWRRYARQLAPLEALLRKD